MRRPTHTFTAWMTILCMGALTGCTTATTSMKHSMVQGNASVTSPASKVVITAHHVKTSTDDITYPQLQGLSDVTVEKALNATLSVNPKKLKLMNPNDTYTSTYKLVYQAGNLLEFDYESYDYPNGAAHGEPNQQLFLMNLDTGQRYRMKDLFRAGSGYLNRLSQLVKVKDVQKVLSPDFSGVKNTDGFILTPDGVQIFFTPYEWAAYAVGFPTFDMSYSELKSIINQNGSLWKNIEATAAQKDLAVQHADIAKMRSLGFQPYEATPTDTELDQTFAAANTSNGQTLYAYMATKGTAGYGNVFFFLGRQYLGTDTLHEHNTLLTLYPDGNGRIVVRYNDEALDGTLHPFTIRFTWSGTKLHVNGQFPSDFAK